MFEKLQGKKRLLMEAELVPVQGDRFQPTGFPDLGAATYHLADGTRMLLVESAQSMANRLESTIIGPDNELVEDLKGLPYIRVELTGEAGTSTNSLIEAHRINSPFIISDEKFQEDFRTTAGYENNKPLNWQKIAKALFKYDVNALLHGVFLANLGDGRVKMPRVISSFIEARNAQEAVSGGVKFNPIDPSGTLRAKKYDKDVYGNVPYQRVEYTAEKITAYFNLDLGLIENYALGKGAYELLIALALYKVVVFLSKETRLRTACDLKLKDGFKVTEPDGFTIPKQGELLELIKERINACKAMFSDPPVTPITTETVIKKKAESSESA